MNKEKQTKNNEPLIIEHESDYEAVSLAWDVEELTEEVPAGALQFSDMPKLYKGDLSNRMPILSEEDLEELTEVASDVIGKLQKEINNYNAVTTSQYDMTEIIPDRPYTGIHDASELEQIAKEKELREMDRDGLYIKLSVAGYDAQGLPQLKATRWDGEELEADQLMDSIAHYVGDMKEHRNKIPFRVGEAIMSIDKPVLEAAYGKEGARQMINDVLILMTPEYDRKVA